MTRLESVRILTKEKKVVAEKIEFNYPGLNFGNTTNQHGRRLEKWSDVSNISSTRVPGKKPRSDNNKLNLHVMPSR